MMDKDRAIGIVKNVMAEHNLDCSDSMADSILLEKTGWPCFWNIPADGTTPEECVYNQVRSCITNFFGKNIMFDYIENWKKELKSYKFSELEPENTVIIIVDMINGFCKEGALYSPRIGKLIEPIQKFLIGANKAGVKDIAALCDSHMEDSKEFNAFPPHAIVGTTEAQLVSEIASLPFDIDVILKYSMVAWFDASLYLENSHGTKNIVVVGNCTDMCIYHNAMYFRFTANKYGDDVRVIVPSNLVDTYDAPNHDANFMNDTFLYHMNLCGVEVVKEFVF